MVANPAEAINKGALNFSFSTRSCAGEEEKIKNTKTIQKNDRAMYFTGINFVDVNLSFDQ